MPLRGFVVLQLGSLGALTAERLSRQSPQIHTAESASFLYAAIPDVLKPP